MRQTLLQFGDALTQVRQFGFRIVVRRRSEAHLCRLGEQLIERARNRGVHVRGGALPLSAGLIGYDRFGRVDITHTREYTCAKWMR